MCIHNSVISYQNEMINNKCLEVTLEKIQQVQSFNKICIFLVIVINGNIIVLTTFKDIKITLQYLQRQNLVTMSYIFKLKLLVFLESDLIPMLDCNNQLYFSLVPHKQNKFLIRPFSVYQETLLSKLLLIRQLSKNRLL